MKARSVLALAASVAVAALMLGAPPPPPVHAQEPGLRLLGLGLRMDVFVQQLAATSAQRTAQYGSPPMELLPGGEGDRWARRVLPPYQVTGYHFTVPRGSGVPVTAYVGFDAATQRCVYLVQAFYASDPEFTPDKIAGLGMMAVPTDTYELKRGPVIADPHNRGWTGGGFLAHNETIRSVLPETNGDLTIMVLDDPGHQYHYAYMVAGPWFFNTLYAGGY